MFRVASRQSTYASRLAAPQVRMRMSSGVTARAGKVEINVEGMMCGGCTSRIEKTLKAVDGVTSVAVSLEKKLATVEVSGDPADCQPKLVDTIKSLGFEASPASK